MNHFENEKKVQKKLAQITVFQVILVLSLPSYAQIIKKIEPSLVFMWTGFGLIVVSILATYFYKQRLKQNLAFVKENQKPQDSSIKSA